jgi:hypothetical protein
MGVTITDVISIMDYLKSNSVGLLLMDDRVHIQTLVLYYKSLGTAPTLPRMG